MGVRCVAWKPGGSLLAVGGWDGKVRLIESTSWTVEQVLEPIRTANVEVVSFTCFLSRMSNIPCLHILTSDVLAAEQTVWKETDDWQREAQGRGIVQCGSGVLLNPQVVGFYPELISLPPTFTIDCLDQACSTPCIVPYMRTDPKSPPPKMGVCQLDWNVDGTLLLVRLGEHKHVFISYHTQLSQYTC